MDNVSSIKSQSSSASPKTPGGISKSLLTPCRRVGLSRKIRKSGVSPFVSPLSGSQAAPEVVDLKKETRKRKERVNEEENIKIVLTPNVNNRLENNTDKSEVEKYGSDLTGTPCRLLVDLPRKKKSKTLLSALNKGGQNVEDPVQVDSNTKTNNFLAEVGTNIEGALSQKEGPFNNVIIPDTAESFKVSKPTKHKSLSKKSPLARKKDTKTENNPLEANIVKTSPKQCILLPKETSPKELTKECIVVIQKKIFKNLSKPEEPNLKTENKPDSIKKASQDILDSDSDEIPLCKISKKKQNNKVIESICDNEDFDDNTTPKVKKLVDKNTSTSNLRTALKNTKVKPIKTQTKPNFKPSQTSFDDDDDFDFSSKRTILIKKTYKVDKPIKAKSTGSITQKDIDDLKARIETKKKLLLAKSMTEDTEELRCLIKKWQKGCQDALMELMDLMKIKFPDKSNMDYSEILQILKIPASLVGYDSDNECFSTPDDASVILSKFNE